MKKKVLFLLPAILLVIGSMWAGGNKQAQGSQIAGNDDLSKRVKMTILMGRQFDVPAGNSIEKMLGDLVNADLEFRLVDRATDSLNNTMNMIIASGDYPDMIQFLSITHVNTYVADGILIPLDDLLKQYGQEVLAIRTNDMFEQCTFNGKRMVVPITDNREASVPIIRMDWLQKLGLKVPTTLDELENCLKAFTE
ncbi:MAG: extracellular solute-binding protein, partial [Treponema sp.]|nr:extracellular solute-binding protein [Treponema sp.]